LDPESREKLLGLYSGEEKWLDAMASVNFFTPDSNWTGHDIKLDSENNFLVSFSGVISNGRYRTV
jgi:hypothetical protein